MSRARFVDTREAESTTLTEALARYVNEVSEAKKGSAQEKVRAKKWQKLEWGNKSLAAIRSSDMAAYRDAELKAGKSTATVRLNLALISHLYTVASKDWGIQGLNNPCTAIRMPKGSKQRERRPTTGITTGDLARAFISYNSSTGVFTTLQSFRTLRVDAQIQTAGLTTGDTYIIMGSTNVGITSNNRLIQVGRTLNEVPAGTTFKVQVNNVGSSSQTALPGSSGFIQFSAANI